MWWFLRLCFWLLLAHWVYAEVHIYSPQAGQVIDRAAEALRIPPHTEWVVYPHLQQIAARISEQELHLAVREINEQLEEVPPVFRK